MTFIKGNKLGKLNNGKKRTEEQKLKNSIAKKGKHYSHRTEFKKGLTPWNKGKPNPKAKNLPQLFKRGQHPWNYDGGKSKLRVRMWHSWKYRQWRSDVFERDNYTCQWCGEKGSRLEAHHIEELFLILKENNIKTIEEALLFEKIWNINNGLTLCVKCHNTTKKYGGRKT
jgi:5-methylcytosine-specific restriction endonuclease McrA